ANHGATGVLPGHSLAGRAPRARRPATALGEARARGPGRRPASSHPAAAALAAIAGHLWHFIHRQSRRLARVSRTPRTGTAAAPSLRDAMQVIGKLCHDAGARLLVNSVHPAAWWRQADGVHLRWTDAAALHARPELHEHALVGVSAHDNDQVVQARNLGADFA